jgi:hypothetical protein
MKPTVKAGGGRYAVGAAFPVGNDEDEADVENQIIHRPRAYKTLKSSEPHERRFKRRRRRWDTVSRVNPSKGSTPTIVSNTTG